MAQGPLSREEQIKLDIDVANKTLKSRKVEVDPDRLDAGVRQDWETLKEAKKNLSPEELRKAMKTVVRLINSNRVAAMNVLPPEVFAKIDILTRTGKPVEELDIDLFQLLVATNQKIAAEQDEMDTKVLGPLAAAKKTVAEMLRGFLETKNARQKAQIAEQMAEAMSLDVETLKIDHLLSELIDEVAGGESLEEGIREVLVFMKKIIGDKVADVNFYLVNEKNHYNQTEQLTKIRLFGGNEPVTRSEFEEKYQKPLFHDKEQQHNYNDEHNMVHVELKIADRRLGVMEIQLIEGGTIDKKIEAFINQVRIRLDGKIDEAMKGRRMARLDLLAHEILDRYGACDDHFEQGIAELMKQVCLFSKATEADLLVVVADEEEDQCDHFIAKRYSDDFDPETLDDSPGLREMAQKRAKEIYRSAGKHELIRDIVDANRDPHSGKKIIGKIIFRSNENEELTDEDKTFLRMASMIIASHASQWRSSLRLMMKGFDPKIAAVEMREGIEDLVREETTTLITDISGYTAICNRLEKKLFKKDKQSVEALVAIRDLVQDFLILCQRLGNEYCGTWDKDVGDMAIIHFGAPIGKKSGHDPLGYGKDERHPEFFAMNALKASLLIQKELAGLSDKFKSKLIKLAQKIFEPPKLADSEETDEWLKFEEDPEQWYLDRLRDEYGLSPMIDTTTAVYTGDAAYTKLKLLSSNDYTLLGTTMNTAARTQGKARREQILIPRRSQQLFQRLIDDNTPVPYHYSAKTGKRREETFTEFLQNKLGLTAETIRATMNEQYAPALKNLEGSSLAYSFELRDAAARIPAKGAKLDAEGLSEFDGQEFSIHHAQIGDGKIKFSLATIPLDGEKGTTFKATVRQGAIEEVIPVYISRSEYEKRRHRNTHRVIRVQDGRFTEFDYKPLGELQKNELDHVLEAKNGFVQGKVINHKNTPSGCYRLLTANKKGPFTTLEVTKGTHIFKVNYRSSRINHGISEIVSNDEVLTDFKAYLGEIMDEIDMDAPNEIIVFVHKGDYYQLGATEASIIIDELKAEIHRSVPPSDDRSHRYTMAPAASPRSTALPSITATMRPPELLGKDKPTGRE